MQPLFTLLLQLSVKAWTALVIAVLCSGAAVVFYFSSTNAGSNSSPGNLGNPANLTVAVQAGHVPDLGPGHQTAPPPVVPEANAGLALIPVTAAMLFFSARRLWLARPSLAAGNQQNAKGASEG
jgi:hypothetical protein